MPATTRPRTQRLTITGCPGLRTKDPTEPRTRQRRQQRKGPNNEQTDHKAANTTMHQQDRCSNDDATINRPHAGQRKPNPPGMQGSKWERRPADWRHHGSHARRGPYPRTRQNTPTLPLYNRQTYGNELLQTSGPPGERKLHGVKRRDCAPRHASPVVRASSSGLTHTENQPRWGCLQDRALGLAPGPWAPESAGG